MWELKVAPRELVEKVFRYLSAVIRSEPPYMFEGKYDAQVHLSAELLLVNLMFSGMLTYVSSYEFSFSVNKIFYSCPHELSFIICLFLQNVAIIVNAFARAEVFYCTFQFSILGRLEVARLRSIHGL